MYEEKTAMTDITTHGKAKIDGTGEHSQSNEEVMAPSADFEDDEPQANGTWTHSQEVEDFMTILQSDHLDLGCISTTDSSSIDLVLDQAQTSEIRDYSSVDLSVNDELKVKSNLWAHSKEGKESMVPLKIDTAECTDTQQAPAQYHLPENSKRGSMQKVKDSWKQAKETEEFNMSLQLYALEQASITLDTSSRYFATEDLP
jgi:hypothetical protein